ncbi:MAG: glycosyltransferase family 2 protein [Pseudomonadota bacterium]|nr:glycosyltransferase family 2 protein [Pseudomonadota bacterium]
MVPCRNERAHVAAFLGSVQAQQLPPGCSMEVIVADGRSDDGTREWLAQASLDEPRLRVVDNGAGIVSSGLNRALDEARGEVVVRMDMHTTYAADYVAQCLAVLAATGADNVGGPWRAEADADGPAWQRAAVLAFQSPWVAGGARSRRLDHEGWVETVYLGAWPRATFARCGGFDEQLVRNQDDEHNLRLVRSGGRVWQSARIRSAYRPRATPRQTARQYLQYGYWKPFVMRKHGQPAAWRHLVPALFVVAVVAAALTSLAGASIGWLAALLAAYLVAVLTLCVAIVASSFPAALQATPGATSAERSGPRRGAVLLRLPLVIATYHLAYGVGSLAGWFDIVRGRGARQAFARSSR